MEFANALVWGLLLIIRARIVACDMSCVTIEQRLWPYLGRRPRLCLIYPVHRAQNTEDLGTPVG